MSGMQDVVPQFAAAAARHEVLMPARRSVPVVFASPHSGTDYPDEFVRASQLDFATLRRSEDSFVDELFDTAPSHGAPLLRALFPRAFIDPNREPFELDPAMFEDELPSYANTQSSRVAAGLGTIARVVSTGQEIYGAKLRFEEAAERINLYYRPYHRAQQQLIEDTKAQYGACLLVDCHSMPSVGGPMDPDAGRGRADFVLGDCFGQACAPVVADTAERALRAHGHSVARNKPFAGGFTTRNYGRPQNRVHVLQIEINRALYMDERVIKRNGGFDRLHGQIEDVIAALCAIPAGQLQ